MICRLRWRIRQRSVEDASASAINVLANDTDVDGGPKSVASVTQPTKGTVVITGGGTGLTYQPAGNFCNNPPGTTPDTFTYTLNGGSTATVSVTVDCANDAPLGPSTAPTYEALANMRLSVPAGTGLLAGATDPDGGTTLTVDNVSITSPAGGLVDINTSTGAFDVTGPPGLVGAMTFTYEVCDDGIPPPSTCSGDITATVNFAGPVIWFVDAAKSTTGNGTLDSPFKTLAEASTAIGTDTGEGVFLFSGSYATGFTLRTSGRLVGQATTGSTFDQLFGLTSVPTGVQARPATAGAAVTVGGPVTLATTGFVRGVAINTTTGGLSGSTITGVDVAQTAVTSTNGPALSLSGVGGSVNLTSLNQAAGTNAVNVANSAADVTIQAGAIASTTTSAVTLDGGAGAFTSVASIAVSAGRAVEVKNRPAASTATFSGSVTATGGTGIALPTNNVSASVVFSGALTLSTGANIAFDASSGTVTATAATNSLTTTTATALRVVDATIGAGGLTFQSISAGTAAAGPASGIVLNNTGTAGGLTVTGTASADSGGTIQKTTGAGISLTNTEAPSFNRMRIDSTVGSGVNGTAVDGFSFTNGTITNSGTTAVVDTSNIAFNAATTNLTGTVTITGNVLGSAGWHGIDIFDSAGTISSATITGNTISSSTDAAVSKGSAIRLQATGTAGASASVTTATLSNNVITNFPSGAGIMVIGGNVAGGAGGVVGSGPTPVTISGNSIQGASTLNRMGTSAIIATMAGRGSGVFTISNNPSLANTTGEAIALGGNGFTTTTFLVQNNTINANNTFGSPGIGVGTGLTFTTADTPTVTATISNNIVSNTDGNGILAVARGATGRLNTKIQSNTVSAPLGGVRPGIRVDAGNGSSVLDTVCLNITGNISAGSGGSKGIGLRRQTGSHVFGVNGMAATSSTGVETYVDGLNPAGNLTVLLSETSGFSNCSLP